MTGPIQGVEPSDRSNVQEKRTEALASIDENADNNRFICALQCRLFPAGMNRSNPVSRRSILPEPGDLSTQFVRRASEFT
jgi:hypothetical protein